MAIGVAAGVPCYAAVTWLKALLGYDDAPDRFGVHAIGGATGAILTWVFAIKEYGGTAGLIEGNAHQVVEPAHRRRHRGPPRCDSVIDHS